MAEKEKMANSLKVVNKLRAIERETGVRFEEISIPRIVLVGGQSAGKSSVLESFVGLDILPRGNEIVTLRPLELTLETSEDKIWGEFGHMKGKQFPIEKVEKEIRSATNKEAPGLYSYESPISLTIHSPNVPNLTLIDLPGVVRDRVGDQPTDIEAQITKMIMKYIKGKNTIILAVTPANMDLA